MAKQNDPSGEPSANIVITHSAPGAYSSPETYHSASMDVDGKRLTVNYATNDRGTKTALLDIADKAHPKLDAQGNLISDHYTAIEPKWNTVDTDRAVRTPDNHGYVSRNIKSFGERAAEPFVQQNIALADKAPALAELVRKAVEVDSPGEVTLSEFKAIRDAFQKLDHGNDHKSNAHLQKPAGSKDRTPQ